MDRFEEDASPLSRRSIPPVSAPERTSEESPRSTSGIWAVATLALALAVPFVSHRLADPPATAATAPEPEAPGLSTTVVREAPVEATPVALRGRRVITVVPSTAVAQHDGKPMVYVADPDLRLLVATPVVLGAVDGQDQHILSGVSAGQVVVTEGVAQLDQRASRF